MQNPENGPKHLSATIINQFLLAGLPGSEVLAVAQHLHECEECRCRKELLEFWGEMMEGQFPSRPKTGQKPTEPQGLELALTRIIRINAAARVGDIQAEDRSLKADDLMTS